MDGEAESMLKERNRWKKRERGRTQREENRERGAKPIHRALRVLPIVW